MGFLLMGQRVLISLIESLANQFQPVFKLMSIGKLGGLLLYFSRVKFYRLFDWFGLLFWRFRLGLGLGLDWLWLLVLGFGVGDGLGLMGLLGRFWLFNWT